MENKIDNSRLSLTWSGLIAFSLLISLISCGKEDMPYDLNSILYGEWKKVSYFESIWENGDTNFIVPDVLRYTFLPNGKVEAYKRVGADMSIERRESFYYNKNNF